MKMPTPQSPPGTAQSPGMACPKCATHIPFTIDSLLVERRFRCPNLICGGVLTLDPDASSEALSLLKKYRDSKAQR